MTDEFIICYLGFNLRITIFLYNFHCMSSDFSNLPNMNFEYIDLSVLHTLFFIGHIVLNIYKSIVYDNCMIIE